MVLAYKWLPVGWTPLMLVRWVENVNDKEFENRRIWVDLEEVDPVLVASILTAEDQRFFTHNGFDQAELKTMMNDHINYGKELRGCSTISQQVAKNCFTFCSRTFLRKVVEAYYTVLIELIWGKERILEVYLSVVETGGGLYGVETACQEYFSSSAANVFIDDALALACILPSPLQLQPHDVIEEQPGKIVRLRKQILNKFPKTY